MKGSLVDQALENLNHIKGIKAKWLKSATKELDANLEVIYNNTDQTFFVENRKELRNHQLPGLIEKAKKFRPFLILAETIFPKIKEELQRQEIAYLDAAGNVFLRTDNIFIWKENNKAVELPKETQNRAFSKAGLKVVFHLLLDKKLINAPYREIAATAQVALGNINYVINGLKELRYVMQIGKIHNLVDKQELLNRWIDAYGEKLKPTLLIGRFRFAKNTDF